MRKSLLLLALLPFALAQAQEPLPKLYPGAKAPEIKVSEWVKNGEVPTTKLHVVEFWATWCPPCRESIPHLTKLAKQYADKVDFAGISVWERGDNIPELVKKFVTGQGDKMDYHVALDTTDMFMAKNWMTAAEQGGIPTAFIVDATGTILWIGHPMSLEEPLKQAVEGKIDVEANKKEFLKGIQETREDNKRESDIQKAIANYKAGKKDEAEKALDDIQKQKPELARRFTFLRLTQLYAPTDKAADNLVKKLLSGSEDDLVMVAQYSLNLANRDATNYKLAIKRANDVLKKSKGTVALYYVANALFKAEEYKNAIKTADKCLEALAKDPNKSQYEKPVTAGMNKVKADAEAKLKEKK